MVKKTLTADGGKVIEFVTSKPFTVKPTIERPFTRDGVRMYLTTDGKEYLADVYDAMFLPAVKLQVRPARYKGASPDHTRDWMK